MNFKNHISTSEKDESNQDDTDIETINLWSILGNENRRLIIKFLSKQPRTVTDLYEKLDKKITKRGIKKILSYLDDIGLLDNIQVPQRRGRPVTYYRIARRLAGSFVIAPNYFKLRTNEIKREKTDYRPSHKEMDNIEEAKLKLRENMNVITEIENELEQLERRKYHLLRQRQQLFQENQRLGSILTKKKTNIIDLTRYTMMSTDELISLMYEDIETMLRLFRLI